MSIKPVIIDNRAVGADNPCFIIAEAGVNHNGCMKTAFDLIDAAADTGVDAIKFQAFKTEQLVTAQSPKAAYQVETTGAGLSQFDMLKKLELNDEQHKQLKEYCERKNLMYICTPYDYDSVDMLDEIGVSCYKIASTDVTNVPFLRYIAQKKRPVILSTGFSSLCEVEQAYCALSSHQQHITGKIILMHCTAEYPAPKHEANLRVIPTLTQAFQVPVGFSDHTVGIQVSGWAVLLGACAIEKHFTLDKKMDGPDHRASIEPAELKELVEHIRTIEIVQGDGIKRPAASEQANKILMQKSLVAKRALPAGHVITQDDLIAKRPATGLPPAWMDKVIGKKTKFDIEADTTLRLDVIDWTEHE